MGLSRLDLVTGLDLTNMKNLLLASVGRTAYEKFYEGYSRKLWGRDPSTLPASTGSRIPVWEDERTSYYRDRYQALPVGGYTKFIQRMLENIDCRLSCSYPHGTQDICYSQLVYSGKIDALFDYKLGRLEYRSLDFVQVPHQLEQAATNYCDEQVPYTREVDYRHFGGQVTLREYPLTHTDANVPMYPVRDSHNIELFNQYNTLQEKNNIIIGGRLGAFRYLDMDKVIGMAMRDADAHS